MTSIIYLSKNNQISRLSPRKFASFKRAKKEGLSANEGYNTAVLGISSLEYAWIREAIHRTCGVCLELASVKTINDWFASPAYLTDSSGRYLTYLNEVVSVRV